MPFGASARGHGHHGGGYGHGGGHSAYYGGYHGGGHHRRHGGHWSGGRWIAGPIVTGAVIDLLDHALNPAPVSYDPPLAYLPPPTVTEPAAPLVPPPVVDSRTDGFAYRYPTRYHCPTAYEHA